MHLLLAFRRVFSSRENETGLGEDISKASFTSYFTENKIHLNANKTLLRIRHDTSTGYGLCVALVCGKIIDVVGEA